MIRSSDLNKSYIVSQSQDTEEDIDELIQKDLELKSKPIGILSAIANIPQILLGVCGGFFFLSLLITLSGRYISFTEGHYRDFLIWDSERTHIMDQFVTAVSEFPLEQIRKSQVPFRTIDSNMWRTNLVFHCELCGNVQSIDNITIMKETEAKIRNMKNWENFCTKDPAIEAPCKVGSLLTVTDLIPNPKEISQTQLEQTVKGFVFQEENWATFKTLFSKSFKEDNLKTEALRDILFFGQPIKIDGKSFKDEYDRLEEQTEIFAEFSQELIDIIEEQNKKYKQIDIYVYSSVIKVLQLAAAGASDMMFILVSIVFVFIYLSIKFGCTFLAGMVLLQILQSFIYTLVLYNVILGVKFFAALNLAVIYPLLGFCAGDAIVMFDAWKQSGLYIELQYDYPKRLALAWRRSLRILVGPALLKTGIFYASATSQLVTIQSFGLWAGSMVIVNFALTVIFFPMVIMLNELVIQYRYCCKKKMTEKQRERLKEFGSLYIVDDEKEKREENLEGGEENNNNNNRIGDGIQESGKLQNSNGSNGSGSPQSSPKDNLYTDEVQNTEQPMRNSSNRGKNGSMDGDDEELQRSPIALKQRHFFERQKTQSISKSFVKLPDDEIKIPYLEQFFSTTLASLLHKLRYLLVLLFTIWTFLALIMAASFPKINKPESFLPEDHPAEIATALVRDEFYQSVAGGNSVSLMMFQGTLKMDKRGTNGWDSSQVGSIIWDDSFEISHPNNQLAFLNTCTKLRENQYILDGTIYCWIEVFYQFCGTYGYAFPVAQEDFYAKLIEYINSPFGKLFYEKKFIGLIDDKLKYMFVVAYTKVHASNNKKENQSIYESFENFVQEQNKESPEGINNWKQTIPFYWSFMDSEDEFVENAVWGVIVTLIASLMFLFIESQNIVLTFIGGFNILSVLMTSLSILKMQGWQLGIAESIVFAGLGTLAVSYTFNMITAYHESPYQDRYNRTRKALKQVGTSILSGGFSSLMAGLILTQAKLAPFQKLGTGIFITCLISVLLSLTYLPAILFSFGPTYKIGTVQIFSSNWVYRMDEHVDQIKKIVERNKEEKRNRATSYFMGSSKMSQSGLGNSNYKSPVKQSVKNSKFINI